MGSLLVIIPVFPPELPGSLVTCLNFRLETSWGRDGVSACLCFSRGSERVGNSVKGG